MTEIKATMAGVVDSVFVEPGTVVEAGQKVMAIESMKTIMEVNTTVGGTVTAIKMDVGEFVDEGDVLLIVE